MKALTKDIFREISKTRSRFISILVMIMLAALFLCGLRSAAPDMQITADRHYDTQKLMDLQGEKDKECLEKFLLQVDRSQGALRHLTMRSLSA